MSSRSDAMVNMLREDFQSMLEWQQIIRRAALPGHAVQQVEEDMRFYMADVLKTIKQFDLNAFVALDLRRTALVLAITDLIQPAPTPVYEGRAVPVA